VFFEKAVIITIFALQYKSMKKILITGGNGLVGKSLKKYIPQGIYLSSKDYDLTNENQVISLFKDYRPDIIIHLAAKVGGILDNIEKPADYFTENILMNSLMVKYSHNLFISHLPICLTVLFISCICIKLLF
jgi:GDP-L-fucose synthase